MRWGKQCKCVTVFLYMLWKQVLVRETLCETCVFMFFTIKLGPKVWWYLQLFSFVYSLPGSSVWKELWDNHVGKRCVRLWENFEGSLKEPWENLERKPRENSERTLIEHCDRTWTDYFDRTLWQDLDGLSLSLSLFLSFSYTFLTDVFSCNKFHVHKLLWCPLCSRTV